MGRGAEERKAGAVGSERAWIFSSSVPVWAEGDRRFEKCDINRGK